MANHYQPQAPPPPIGPRGFFTGIQIRPIVAGVIVDYVATYILGILYLIFFFMKEPFEGGGPSQEALEKTLGEMLSSPEALIALAVIGALCTALGGYVAGRMAKSDEIKHGALVGVVSLVLGTLQIAGSGAGHPLPEWYEFVAYVVAIPAGALGGYFAQSASDLRWGGGTFPSG